ncbi:MAG: Fe-S oxidoreductase [Acidobacteria bacterium]|nr:MAG: Fe-S oxidoreductase [Acidobacteriota bacterium]
MSSPAASKSVHLFHTCLVNEIDPDVGMAVVRVLERAGVVVHVPADQTCCGQPAYNAGYHDEARQVARHTLQVLSQTRGPIVIPSGSCADMLVHQYAVLFQDDPHLLETARAVAKRCREFSQFLAEIAPHGVGGELPVSVAYARQIDVRDQEECCGFGGLFSVKNAEISTGMLDRKLAAVEASGAERLVSCDLGCLLHLGGGLHRRGSPIRAQHLAQFLDEASGADK